MNTFHALDGRKNSYDGRKNCSHRQREILIKGVAQAIPTYTMSVFKLPNTLCDDMTGTVYSFWWGQSNGKKNMA